MQKTTQRPVDSIFQCYFAFTTLALLCVMTSARAGRPMIVDDAGIVGANSCQLESWVYNGSNGTEYWAVPACNFSGNLEIALGGAHIDGTGQRGTVAVLQGKTLFKPLDSNGWGAGLVFGTQTVLGNSGLGDVFATVPVSFSFHNNRIVTHTNAGFVRVKSSGRTLGTWGAGVEVVMDERSTFTAETFGQQGGKPLVQFGVKYWLTPDRLQLDATYGNRVGNGSKDRFMTIGLVLFTNFVQ